VNKLFILFLLSAYCLSVNAATVVFESQEDSVEADIDIIDTDVQHEIGSGFEERAFVAETLKNIQQSSESVSKINHQQKGMAKEKQMDYEPKVHESKIVEPETSLQFNPFAEPEDASFILSRLASEEPESDPVIASREFIGSIVLIGDMYLIEDAMTEMVDESVNMALNVKGAWNTLDEQVTNKFYQGASKVGFDVEYSDRNSHSEYRDVEAVNLFALASESEGKGLENKEPEGLFVYVLYFPKFLTVSNLLIVLGILFLLNGIYRLMRFFLLRI